MSLDEQIQELHNTVLAARRNLLAVRRRTGWVRGVPNAEVTKAELVWRRAVRGLNAARRLKSQQPPIEGLLAMVIAVGVEVTQDAKIIEFPKQDGEANG